MAPRPLELGLRAAVAIVALLAISIQFGGGMASALLPVFREEIELLVPHIHVRTLGLTHVGSDNVVALEAAPATVVMIAGKLLPLAPQTRFRVSTLLGHLFQTWILFAALLTTWPITHPQQRFTRLAWLVPGLLFLALADIPLVLAAELEQTLQELAERSSPTPLTAWSGFLESGGRVALPIILAAAAIAFERPGTGTNKDDGPS